ncbi:hypothetical protein AX16_004717 [Volvariella volvacea WC 439]|nr:hypothetical protein AX16_004717 [Volvariella volvacea WC 439]
MSEVKNILDSHPADMPVHRDDVLRHLALLEDEQSRLTRTSEFLSQLQDTVDTQLQNVYRTMIIYNPELVPINRLSIEILRRIFSYCFPPTEVRCNFWAFERVSRRWRRAILGCAELWSYLHISGTVLWWSKTRDPLGMVDTWLKRSAQSPLDIFFGRFEYNRNDHALSLFFMILQHCRRWKTVTLQCSMGPSDPEILPALGTMRGKFPLLRSLYIHIFPWGYGTITSTAAPYAIQAFSDAPNLSKMTLSHFNRFFRVIVASNSVTSLSINDPKFLEDLTLPNLQELEISGHAGYNMSPTVVEFLQRSGCKNIKSLRAHYYSNIEMLGVEEVFGSLPSLESLGLFLYNKELIRNILPHLRISGQQVPLPNLCDLTLSTNHAPVAVDAVFTLVEVLEERRRNNGMTTNLRKFSWLCFRGTSEIVNLLRRELKWLHDDGLSIKVT